MPTRKILYRRKFLNRPRHHEGAHVIASIELVSPEQDEPRVDGTLILADCRRNVHLDFDICTPSEARNAAHKARVLRDILTEYVDALDRAVEAWEDERARERGSTRNRR